MNEKIIKMLLVVVCCLFIDLFFSLNNVKASSDVSMNVYIDENGNANITEKWISNDKKLKHSYPSSKSKKFDITNLKVESYNTYFNLLTKKTETNVIEYKVITNDKNDISKSDNLTCKVEELEDGRKIISWDKSEAENYVLSYTITNFITELKDAQISDWTYNLCDNPITSIHLKISTFYKLPDSTEFYKEKYKENVNIHNGCIEVNSSTKNSYDDISLLIKFPKGTFNNVKNKRNYSYKRYINKYKNKEYIIIYGTIDFALTIILMILGNFYFYHILYSFLIGKGIFKIYGYRVKRNAKYCRNIPCSNNLYRCYLIAEEFGLLKNKIALIGAIILRWEKDEIVKIENRNKETVISFIANKQSILKLSEQENKLYHMLKTASKDGILENRELKKYCKKNYRKVANWFNNMISNEIDKMIEEGLIKVKNVSYAAITRYLPTEELIKEAEEIMGLKKFLKDYTKIKEKEPLEVHLMEEYLVYAQMLGIAKKVNKRFKKLYPDKGIMF